METQKNMEWKEKNGNAHHFFLQQKQSLYLIMSLVTDDAWHEIIHNKGLYEKDFLKQFDLIKIGWGRQTSRQKELSLRHDYVCYLLCNLETQPTFDAVDAGTTIPPRKKQKLMGESSSSSGKSSASVILNPCEDLEDILDLGLDVEMDTEDIDMDDDIKSNPLLRFICLEGMSGTVASATQNAYALAWGIEPPTSEWDIIDKTLHKFIEVKVSQIPKEADFLIKCNGDTANYSLVVVDPKIGNCRWYHHPGGLDGEIKVKQFIIKFLPLGKLRSVSISTQKF